MSWIALIITPGTHLGFGVKPGRVSVCSTTVVSARVLVETLSSFAWLTGKSNETP